MSSISTVLAALETHFSNKLDILVLNAAYNTRPALGTASNTDITNSLTANLHWPIVLMENLVRQALFTPCSRVVLMSSDRVRDPNPGSSLFTATKTAL